MSAMLMKKILMAAAAGCVTTGLVLGAAGQLQIYPSVEGHGGVVRLPGASDQPRDGSRICVDLTKGGPADQVNPAIEKVARFVNIYAGAGKVSATVEISVILHGDATLIALSDKAYAKRFNSEGNPNLPLIRKLRQSGVEILVCGQALAHKEASEAEVGDQVEVAVSALTVNVNRQQDGFAFIPLH